MCFSTRLFVPLKTNRFAMIDNVPTKMLWLVLMCLPALFAAQASSFVRGRIYLKNGTVIECSDKDRIRLPKRSGNVAFFRNTYRKDEVRENFQAGQIDSIIAWHPATPEHVRKFVPSERFGWLWIYFETPCICVGIYSVKGYGIDTNGGIQVLQRRGLVFHSRTAYCLKKAGKDDFEAVGAAGGKAGNGFRKRVAEYVEDDAEMADRILNSKAPRDKTILMLCDYNPTK